MSFFDEGRVMVRVAVNEMQPRAVNANIPYGARAVADAAIACAGAGASIVHLHSRTDDGQQATDDDDTGASTYRRALELTARDSDVIMEPTNLPRGHDPSLAIDVPHFWALLDEPPKGAPLEFVNIDGFRFAARRAAWDERTQRLVEVGDREVPLAAPEVIQRVLANDLVPFFGLFDLAEARLLAAFVATGLVPEPVFVQFNLFHDIFWGPTPGIAALDAFLAEWRRTEIDSEVCLFVRAIPDRAAYESLLHAALERGVHLRVGLGDNPDLFPGATNAELVAHAVDLAAGHGLTPTTPAELRARSGSRASGRSRMGT